MSGGGDEEDVPQLELCGGQGDSELYKLSTNQQQREGCFSVVCLARSLGWIAIRTELELRKGGWDVWVTDQDIVIICYVAWNGTMSCGEFTTRSLRFTYCWRGGQTILWCVDVKCKGDASNSIWVPGLVSFSGAFSELERSAVQGNYNGSLWTEPDQLERKCLFDLRVIINHQLRH